MSVEDWARREADRVRRADDTTLTYDMEEDAFAAGIVHAFSLLLSDEAVGAARKVIAQHPRQAVTATQSFTECECGLTFRANKEGWADFGAHGIRAALQAAIAAVTEGDTE